MSAPEDNPDSDFVERVPDPAVRGRMLPGIAGILIFLLLLSVLNVYGAVSGIFGQSALKYGVLTLCTMLLIGLSGLVRMRRWGWSIVLAGCALLAGSYAYGFTTMHQLPFAIQGAFMLVFFLYLVRPDVRDRML